MAHQIEDENVNIRAKGTRNRLSKPHRSVNKCLASCLQRSVVFGYERKRKDFNFQANNIVLQIMSMEHDFDFHRKNRDIHIFLFSIFNDQIVPFNPVFGIPLIRPDNNNSWQNEYHW
jgi:hypothetical protein